LQSNPDSNDVMLVKRVEVVPRWAPVPPPSAQFAPGRWGWLVQALPVGPTPPVETDG